MRPRWPCQVGCLEAHRLRMSVDATHKLGREHPVKFHRWCWCLRGGFEKQQLPETHGGRPSEMELPTESAGLPGDWQARLLRRLPVKNVY